MRLILIRHGKATYGSFNGDCMLLPECRVQLAKDFPYLKGLFLPHGKVHIYHSPKNRAKETAEMARDHSVASGCDLHCTPAVLDGNLSLFFKEIQHIPWADTVIAVGHEPTMSIWLEKITGQMRIFGKGSSAVVDMASLDPPVGELTLFLNPNDYENAEPCLPSSP